MLKRLVSSRFLPTGLLLLAPALVGCAGAQRSGDSSVRIPPGVSVRLLASGPQTPGGRELGSGDLVHAAEQVEMDVTVLDRPGHIYVALYEPAGPSTLLYGGAEHRRATPGEPVRISVPRRAMPGGGPAAEVRLFVVASEKPLEQALCPLLRVRCPLDGPAAPPVAAAGGDGQKQCDAIPDPPAAPGLHTAATVLPIVVKYE